MNPRLSTPIPVRRLAAGALLLLALAALVPGAAAAKVVALCPVSTCVSVSSQELTQTGDHNLRLAVYGKLFNNARACPAQTLGHLKTRLDADLACGGCFNRWLDGVNVQMAFATALVLGGRGSIDGQLHARLEAAYSKYSLVVDPCCGLPYQPGSCGTCFDQQSCKQCSDQQTCNLCMDDWSQDAVARAWMAAYFSLAEPYSLRAISLAGQANSALLKVLSDDPATGFCILDLSTHQCDGTVWDLGTPGYTLASFNHRFSNPSYGIGLMTSVASAVKALEIGGFGNPLAGTNFYEARLIADALFAEGQAHALADGSAFCGAGSACACLDGITFQATADCSDAAIGYRPKMYPVYKFYQQAIWPYTGGAGTGFAYNVADRSLFSATDPFFSLGRRAIYIGLAFDWWRNCQPAVAAFEPPEVHVTYNRYGTPQHYALAGPSSPTLSFDFDVSQGRFEERPGNGCFNPQRDNPDLIELWVEKGDAALDACRFRDFQDSGWNDCTPGIVALMQNGGHVIYNSDPFTSDTSILHCPLTTQPRYPLHGTGWWEIEMSEPDSDPGESITYPRRLNFRRVQ